MESVALTDSSKSTPIPVCSKCNNYPLFSIVREKPENVKIDCPHCGEKNEVRPLEEIMESMASFTKESAQKFCSKHETQKAFCYCFDCERWICKPCHVFHMRPESTIKNHLFGETDKMIMKTCRTHQEQFSSYCTECRKNLCQQCKSSHEHKGNSIIQTTGALETKNCKKYNDFLRSMKKHSNYIAIVFKNLMELIDEYKKQITEAFDKTNKINNNIISMYRSFIDQATMNKFNYHIHENLENFGNFSFKTCKFDTNKLELKNINGSDLIEYKNYITEGAIIIDKKTSNLHSLQKIKECNFANFVSSLAYYRNEVDKEDCLLVGFNNGTIGIANFASENIENQITVNKTNSHKGSILSIHIDGNFIYTAGSDHTINKWEITKETKIDEKGETKTDEKRKARTNKKGETKIQYQIQFRSTFLGHKDEVNKIIILPQQNTIISFSFDNSIIVWDTSSDEKIIKAKQKITMEDRITSILLCKDNKHFLVATEENVLHLMSITDYKIKYTLNNIYCCSPGCLVYKEDDIFAFGNKQITCISHENEEIKLKGKKVLKENADVELRDNVFSVIPTEDNEVILCTLKKSLIKLNPVENNEKDKKEEEMQVKTFSYKENIEGLYQIFNNKYAIIFGKRVEILSN